MRATPMVALATTFALALVGCSEPTAAPTQATTVAPPDLSVSATGSTVTIYPGQSIQAAVNSHPAGTTFLLKAGTFYNQTVVPKSGDVFIGERGTVLDGGRRVAFAFNMGYRTRRSPYPSNVRIEGLTIQNYVPGFQKGAVHAGRAGGNPAARTTGWIVKNCEIRYNIGAGLSLGHRMQVLYNKIHHNDQIGVRGSGDDIVFQGNEIAYNNPSWHYDFTGEGRELGGIKFSHTHRLVARGNYVHDNNGPGMWTDIDNVDALYEGNRAERNAAPGIFHEISYRAVIRNNVVLGNGFARGNSMYGGGILVSNSRDVEVYGNTVTGNKMGITANQLNRGSGKYGAYVVQNLYVHDNTVQTSGQTGLQSGSTPAAYTSWNNRFRNNTYLSLRSNGSPFFWMNSRKTVVQWRAYGHDATGRFLQ